MSKECGVHCANTIRKIGIRRGEREGGAPFNQFRIEASYPRRFNQLIQAPSQTTIDRRSSESENNNNNNSRV